MVVVFDEDRKQIGFLTATSEVESFPLLAFGAAT
jgi:hypothetical protein